MLEYKYEVSEHIQPRFAGGPVGIEPLGTIWASSPEDACRKLRVKYGLDNTNVLSAERIGLEYAVAPIAAPTTGAKSRAPKKARARTVDTSYRGGPCPNKDARYPALGPEYAKERCMICGVPYGKHPGFAKQHRAPKTRARKVERKITRVVGRGASTASVGRAVKAMALPRLPAGKNHIHPPGPRKCPKCGV